VLADKPWIIRPEDLPRLTAVLDLADRKGVVAYDIMTERHEFTSFLQREIVSDPATFGTIQPGSPEHPAVFMESVHYLRKQVAGAPLRRPTWFFDIHEQGEALSDVGTHLVDLVPWMLFPDQPIDYRHDIKLLTGRRWPTELDRDQFREVTGESDFPPALASAVHDGRLSCFCNNYVGYTLRGVHVGLNVLWGYQSEAGLDTHLARFAGSRSCVEVRQTSTEQFVPHLYVVPNDPADKEGVRAALEAKAASLRTRQWNVEVADLGDRLEVTFPSSYLVGHEAHFAEVMRQFLHYLEDRSQLPGWEKPNMLAKYHVTTGGVALASRVNS
jgi:predicted dehydrogenase